jgi:PiT family inorganic phosphate transporter
MSLSAYPEFSFGTKAQCVERYQGKFWGIDAGVFLDAWHYLSAGAVSFARGLNDTPKIAAILLAAGVFDPRLAVIGVGVLMALGGILSARKVAQTMSLKITEMNHAQGFLANLVTSLLVIGASGVGMPVSTTHVSCGSLFGLGSVTGKASWKMIAQILSSWIITLPVAAALGAVIFFVLEGGRWEGGR